MTRMDWLNPRLFLSALLLSTAMISIVRVGVFAQKPPADSPMTERSIGKWHIIRDTAGHWVWVWGDEPAQSGSETSATFHDMTYVADVTVPDNMVFVPGERFDKTWRVRNAGSGVWELGSRLSFVSGNRMEGKDVAITQIVSAGDLLDITVSMIAPLQQGDYAGVWQMVDSAGRSFGQDLTVVIQVEAGMPGPEATPIPEKQFTAQGLRWSPNCGIALVKGYIYDGDGNPVNGIRVRLWSDEWEGAISLVSGVGITYAPGEWDISLQRGQTGHFYLSAWDWQTGPNSYAGVDSEEIGLDFDYSLENCEPGGNGHQVAEVNFIRNY